VIEHVWSVICQNAAVDNETGNVSLFNILETITILGEASEDGRLPINYEVFSEWVREDENQPAKGTMRLFFSSPGNEGKQQVELPVDLSEHLFARTRIKLNVLKINGSGRYKFIIKLKMDGSDQWELKATLPLIVMFSPDSEVNKGNR